MSLTLLFHPFASFCQKVLIGFYELELPFEKQLVDLGDPEQRAALLKLWPMGKFPVLRDTARDLTLPESSIILEYIDELAATAPERSGRNATRLIPSEPDAARECRLRDRFFDLHVEGPMQKLVLDKLRPAGQHDAYGVEQARAELETAYAVADDWLRAGPWAIGSRFSMADCAAAPALLYSNELVPFSTRFPHLARYFARLSERPSFARVLEEAKPYWPLFPR